jgi:hypothetical protein
MTGNGLLDMRMSRFENEVESERSRMGNSSGYFGVIHLSFNNLKRNSRYGADFWAFPF